MKKYWLFVIFVLFTTLTTQSWAGEQGDKLGAHRNDKGEYVIFKIEEIKNLGPLPEGFPLNKPFSETALKFNANPKHQEPFEVKGKQGITDLFSLKPVSYVSKTGELIIDNNGKFAINNLKTEAVKSENQIIIPIIYWGLLTILLGLSIVTRTTFKLMGSPNKKYFPSSSFLQLLQAAYIVLAVAIFGKIESGGFGSLVILILGIALWALSILVPLNDWINYIPTSTRKSAFVITHFLSATIIAITFICVDNLLVARQNMMMITTILLAASFIGSFLAKKISQSKQAQTQPV